MPSIRIDEHETIDLLKTLISINSVNPSLMADGPGERQIAGHIRAFMESVGLEVHVTEPEPGRPNVVGLLRARQKEPGRTLMLNGHTDTVGFGTMDIDPLDPMERDGRVYGRGSADMKAGVTAMLAAAAAVARSGLVLRGDLIVAAVADEEYASIGTEALVRAYTADAAIVTEPTHLDVVIAHKGFAWIDIETTGRAAHGSRPDEGIDAIVLMGEVLVALRDLERTTL
ncbi:MAG: M20/M25/M40 family metallo-hydrolase, partial [Candidatus Latescibacteria bacterium]|nr:M20/M25/M40 family metallo-hydrolase [Candidatus Latescibacterota bacterium]